MPGRNLLYHGLPCRHYFSASTFFIFSCAHVRTDSTCARIAACRWRVAAQRDARGQTCRTACILRLTNRLFPALPATCKPSLSVLPAALTSTRLLAALPVIYLAARTDIADSLYRQRKRQALPGIPQRRQTARRAVALLANGNRRQRLPAAVITTFTPAAYLQYTSLDSSRAYTTFTTTAFHHITFLLAGMYHLTLPVLAARLAWLAKGVRMCVLTPHTVRREEGKEKLPTTTPHHHTLHTSLCLHSLVLLWRHAPTTAKLLSRRATRHCRSAPPHAITLPTHAYTAAPFLPAVPTHYSGSQHLVRWFCLSILLTWHPFYRTSLSSCGCLGSQTISCNPGQASACQA